MSNLSTVDTYYIPQIATLLGTIVFDSSTLASLGLVNIYDQAIKDNPLTQINVCSESVASSYFESKMNKRKYNVKIKIYCYNVGVKEPRLLRAEQDLNYLEEQIVALLENNLETIQADKFTYSGNDSITTSAKRESDGYYVKEIMWSVYNLVVVNN